MRDILLGVEVGTTGVKGIALRPGVGILAQAWRPQELLARAPGWAEMDPDGWWQATTGVLSELAAHPGVGAGSVAAVGVSGMVPAVVLLDSAGEPVRPSIQQNDARTAAQLAQMERDLPGAEVYRITGGSINQQLVGPKAKWLQEHEPDGWGKARHMMGSYDYVNYRLTGRLGIEVNWALESGLSDLRTGAWHAPYLRWSGISPEMLPPVRRPSEPIGTLTSEAARLSGLDHEVLVVGGAADHVASAFAAGLINEGDLNLKFGGAGDILLCLDSLLTDPRLYIDHHLVPGKYLINGCMAASGSLVKWFAGLLHGLRGTEPPAYAELDRRAADLSPGGDGLVILPYFLGEKTPLHDPLARGAIIGLGLHHGPADIHRAILEAVAFGFRHHLEILAELGLRPSRAVATDGGARSALWRQITADVLRLPVAYQADHPGSALGAAFAAGIGAGLLSDWRQICEYTHVTAVTEPRPWLAGRYDELYGIYRAAYPALRPAFQKMAGLPAAAGLGLDAAKEVSGS